MMNKLILLLILSVFTFSAQAAFTGYIKIDDIPGESKDRDHEDEIDILAFGWNTSQDSKRICLEDLTILKSPDRASPRLLMNNVIQMMTSLSDTHYPRYLW